jgi:aminoglycoside phosphotransferase (APT) family kinase protein
MDGGGVTPAGIGGPVIEAALGAAEGRSIRLATGPDPLGGGLSATLVTFRVADPPTGWEGELVLRVPRDPAGAASEFVLQRAAGDAGFPAPRVVAMDTTGDNRLGRPWVLMPRVSGRLLFADAGPLAMLRGLRQVPAELARLMLALHDIDAGPVLADLHATGTGPNPLGADGLLRDIDRGGDRLPGLLAWLTHHRPPPAGPVVCHGDLHALNVLADGTRRCVVDWELATVGDPALDVARTALLLAAVPVDMPARVRPVVQRLGRGAAARFVRSYTGHRSLDAGALEWYQVLHAGRIVARLSGRDPEAVDDPVLDAWAPTAPFLCARIEAVTGIGISRDRRRPSP